MNGWSLTRIAELTNGRLENAPEPERVCSYGAVGIDTRRMTGGELFVAVRGARDGHDFLREAGAKGAVAALVDHRVDLDAPSTLPLIRVGDPVKALSQWAGAHRREMPAEIITVTGSSGKTTTKDLIASILAAEQPTLRTEGNQNNHLGVPLTLLGLRREHRWGVIEIATNHPGEIAPLARLTRPKHLVLTRVGWAHVGAFGGREAILAEKLSAVEALPSDGVLFHEADPWLLDHLPADLLKRRRRTFGLDPKANSHPIGIEWDWDETRFSTPPISRIGYRCPGPGACIAAMAAILIGSDLEISPDRIRLCLESARPRSMRMEPRRLGRARALLDCYNASPESSQAAIEFLRNLPTQGRTHLAFGEMLELGDASVEAHRNLGVAAAPLDLVYGLGEGVRPLLDAYRSGGGSGYACLHTTHEDLAADLISRLDADDIVLFKGARRMEMEKVYELATSGINRTGGVDTHAL